MSPTKMNYPNDLNTNINCEELVIPAVGTIASVLYIECVIGVGLTRARETANIKTMIGGGLGIPMLGFKIATHTIV